MAPSAKAGKRKDQGKPDANLAIHGAPYELCKAALKHFDLDTPVRYALRPAVRRALEAGAADDQKAEFPDAEWFALAEAIFVTNMLLAHLERSLEVSAYEMVEPPGAVAKADAEAAADSKGGSKKGAAAAAQTNGSQKPTAAATSAYDWPFAGQYIMATRAGLKAAQNALESHMAARAEAARTAGKLAPRFMRLVERLGTSPKETAVLQYMLHKQTLQADLGSLFSRKVAGGASAISPAAYAEMDTLEVLEFVKPHRKHVKEGLIPDSYKAVFQTSSESYDYMYSSSPGGSFSSSSLHLAGEVVKALMGETLTAEDLLKLDKTTMLEVLEEEEGFKAAHSFGEPANDASVPAPKPTQTTEDLMAEGDLFELIKREQTRDASIRKRSLSDALDVDGGANTLKKARRDALPATLAADAEVSAVPADAEYSPMDATAAGMGTPAAAVGTPARADGGTADASDAAPEAENGNEIREYRTDLEFLEDSFRLLITLLRVGKLKRVMALDETDQNALEEEVVFYDRSRRNPKARAAQQLRELEGRERLERSRIERRLHLTSLAGEWRPRLERLSEARGLAPFERQVLLLLVGFHVSPSVQRTFAATRSSYDELSPAGISVGALLLSFLPVSLREQISARRFFYKSGRLIKDGIITLSGTDFSRDIMDQGVDVDRRMLDFLVGLDTEFSDLVDGSHLYFPSAVRLDHVVLPTDQKKLIVETVQNFAAYRKVRKMLEPDGSAAGGGGGVVLLFHGPSGVGKTMMANAVAQHVHKKVLLINFPSLGNNEAGEAIRFIFREAKIHDALLFFDECESIFEDREKGTRHVNLMLTEVEKHDGIIIMATNRPQDLDEAMHRRITMTFEFRKPDHVQRQMIWRRQLPDKVKLDADVDVNELALKYELAGGYIRNAVQAALSRATARSSAAAPDQVAAVEAEDVRLSQADLLHGAKLQLRGALRMKDFDRRRVPTLGLDDVLLPDELKSKLGKVVQHEKARAVLMGQWGFGQKGDLAGTVCLFSGPPGTGKTLAAEAIGFETGKPLKVVNCAGLVSKWVGDTPKNIDALFQEARAMDAVLVFDECESLFGTRSESASSSSDRYASMDVGVLLHHLENHVGIVVLITNRPASLDSAFQRRIRFELKFEMPPGPLRAKLWRLMLPQQAPLGKIDWEQLGRSYELAGGSIKNAVVRAATRAALRMSKDGEAKITMEDLAAEAKEEAGKGDGAAPIGMYN